MDSNKPGWFYVGDGWLRYRDERGWTGHFVEAESVRGSDGPPPAPPAFSHASRVDELEGATSVAPGRGVGLRIRAPRLTRGRRRGR